MSTLIHERVQAARAGTNPTVICQMPSGWAVLCDVQFLRGYSLLLPDPVVPDLNALDKHKRAEYLLDMTILGDALLAVTGHIVSTMRSWATSTLRSMLTSFHVI